MLKIDAACDICGSNEGLTNVPYPVLIPSEKGYTIRVMPVVFCSKCTNKVLKVAFIENEYRMTTYEEEPEEKQVPEEHPDAIKPVTENPKKSKAQKVQKAEIPYDYEEVK